MLAKIRFRRRDKKRTGTRIVQAILIQEQRLFELVKEEKTKNKYYFGYRT